MPTSSRKRLEKAEGNIPKSPGAELVKSDHSKEAWTHTRLVVGLFLCRKHGKLGKLRTIT